MTIARAQSRPLKGQRPTGSSVSDPSLLEEQVLTLRRTGTAPLRIKGRCVAHNASAHAWIKLFARQKGWAIALCRSSEGAPIEAAKSFKTLPQAMAFVEQEAASAVDAAETALRRPSDAGTKKMTADQRATDVSNGLGRLAQAREFAIMAGEAMALWPTLVSPD